MNKSQSVLLCLVGVAFSVALAVYIVSERRPSLSTDRSTGEAIALDSITLPPESQTFVGGDYQLVISSADGWQTPVAIAALSKGDEPLWQKTLPHQYGPRFALVSPLGQVLLLDEHINIASDHAIALINAEGKTIADYSFDDVHRKLQDADRTITRADMVNQAKSGWWISAPPTLIPAGTHAHVETSGTIIQIHLQNGVLTPSPS